MTFPRRIASTQMRIVAVGLAVLLVAAAPLIATPAAEAQAQDPYRPHDVPGVVQAEHYDTGGQGVAYADSDAGNAGGALRNDRVDIFPKFGEDGFTVGRTRPNEWLEYTVNVRQPGRYVVDARMASGVDSPGGVAVSIDGRFLRTLDASNTDTWWNWERVVSPAVELSRGSHVVRLSFVNNPRLNLDSFEMRRIADNPADNPVDSPVDNPADGQRPFVAVTAPATVQAENYDLGGAGVAFSDTDAQNFGGAVRSDAVDVWQTPDGSGFVVGRTRAGEWLEYSIEVREDGRYIIDARMASGVDSPGGVAVSIDGTFFKTLNASNTGTWWTWERVATPATELSAGRHVIRLSFVNNPRLNLDSFDIRRAESPQPGGTVRVRTTDLLSELVANNPAGTTFTLDAGTHTRVRGVEPKNDQKFIGQDGAVINGNGAVASAFVGGGDRVEIRNLEIRGYRPGVYGAPINPRNLRTFREPTHDDGENWVVADNYLHSNFGAGVSVANGMRVENNTISRNEQIGISGVGSPANPLKSVSIIGNEINGNAAANPTFDFEYHEGGIKTTFAENLEIRDNNIHDNRGVGIYCDLFCKDISIVDNEIRNNSGRNHAGGIFVEVVDGATITNNVIDGVGDFVQANPLWGGVTVAESQNVLVANNQITMNGSAGLLFRNGTTISDNAGNVGREPLRNVEFRDNLLTATSVPTRVGRAGGTPLNAGAVRFTSNDYRTTGNGSIRFYPDRVTVSWTQWRNLGYDTAGTLR